MRQQGISGRRGVRAGSCQVWHLPADATCAAIARQVFRDAVAELGLEPEVLDDCILMASELAASTLHARAGARAGGGGYRLVSVATDKGGEPVTSASPTPPVPAVPPVRLYEELDLGGELVAAQCGPAIQRHTSSAARCG